MVFPGEVITELAWAPDGKRLAIGSFTEGTNGSLWQLAWPSRELTPVARSELIDPFAGVAAGPDGDTYWYQRNPKAGIWTKQGDETDLAIRVDEPGPAHLSWTEDGIVGVVDGGRVVAYSQVDGSMKLLFEAPEGSVTDFWAGDNGDMVIDLRRQPGPPTLLVRAGGVEREIAMESRFVRNSALTPSRDSIVYEDHERGQVLLRDLETGATRVLLDEEAFAASLSESWVLAFARTQDDGTRALCFAAITP